MEKTRNNLNFIYIFKFISAIIIAICLHWGDHLITNLGYDNIIIHRPLLFLTSKTYVLVELFFIMSGILFYVVTSEKIKNDSLTFKDYMIKRLSRLLPIVFLSTFFMYICNLILYFTGKNLFSVGSTSLFELFLGLSGGKAILTGEAILNGPIWYIGIYIILIIIAYYLSIKSKKYGDKVYLIPIIVSFIIFYNFLDILPSLSYILVRGLSSYFIGVLLGKFLVLYNDFSSIKKELVKVVSLLFIIFYVVIFYLNKLDNFYSPNSFTYSLFVFTPIIIFIYDFKLLNKLFSLKIFKFLGNISYSIYVWNFPICITIYMLYVYKVITFNVYSIYFFIILFIIHIIIGILSYCFLEEKFKNIKFSFLDKLLN